jgi:hypothetical protein
MGKQLLGGTNRNKFIQLVKNDFAEELMSLFSGQLP